jgi:UDP-GlcNAc:undecaprenyl-phosphate/decaprenyl-phosphate GlcNAc-1-phosphate transferase
MGGIVLLSAFVPVVLYFVQQSASHRWGSSLLIWLISVVILAATGIADDRHTLSPKWRLIISFAVFGLAAAIDPTFNIRVLDFSTPAFSIGLGSWWLAIIFSAICLVGLVNAVNMADGKNGLVLGLCLAWLTFFSLKAPVSILPVLLMLIAICIVLLVFNLKGLLFLGDGGVYGLATAIGMMAMIIYNTPGETAIRAVFADELMLIFAVPIIDSFRLSFKRVRAGRSPMAADRDHLHHHLQAKFGWPAGLFFYLCLAALPIISLYALRALGV